MQRGSSSDCERFAIGYTAGGIARGRCVVRTSASRRWQARLGHTCLGTLEDKIVQVAVAEVLSAIYEADFLECSFGFRPGRGRLVGVPEPSRMLLIALGIVSLTAMRLGACPRGGNGGAPCAI